MLEILKKSLKTGDRFTAISDLQTMRSMLYLELGIGNSIKSFQSKFMVPRLRYKKYSCLKGQRYSSVSESNS